MCTEVVESSTIFPLFTMTMSQSFLQSNSSASDRDLRLNIQKPVLTAAALSMFLAGCGAATVDVKDDETSPVMQQEENSDDGMMKKDVSDAMMNTSTAPTDSMMKSEPAAAMKDTTTKGMMASSYKDGTYAADGMYTSPAGEESVHVSFTLKNGVVESSTYQGTATLGKSQQYQEAFGMGYQEMVTGKMLDEIALDVVNGSSLTPKGFMDALLKIKVEAKG